MNLIYFHSSWKHEKSLYTVESLINDPKTKSIIFKWIFHHVIRIVNCNFPFFFLRFFSFVFSFSISIHFFLILCAASECLWCGCIVVLSLIFHHYSSIFPNRSGFSWYSWMMFFSVSLNFLSTFSVEFLLIFFVLFSCCAICRFLYSSSSLYCIRSVKKKLHLRPQQKISNLYPHDGPLKATVFQTWKWIHVHYVWFVLWCMWGIDVCILIRDMINLSTFTQLLFSVTFCIVLLLLLLTFVYFLIYSFSSLFFLFFFF